MTIYIYIRKPLLDNFKNFTPCKVIFKSHRSPIIFPLSKNLRRISSFFFFFFFLFLKHDVKLYSKILNTDISIFESTKFIEIQYPPFRELINVRNIEIIVKSRRSNVDRSKSKKVAADQGSGLFTLETRRGGRIPS